jgi:hypothetical protein
MLRPVSYVFVKPTNESTPIKLVQNVDKYNPYFITTKKERVFDLDLLELTIQYYLDSLNTINSDSIEQIPPIYEYRPPRPPNRLFKYEHADYTPRPPSLFEDLKSTNLKADSDPNYFRIPRPPIRYLVLQMNPLKTPFGYTHSNNFIEVFYQHETGEIQIKPGVVVRDPELCQAILHIHIKEMIDKPKCDTKFYLRELYLE